MENKQADKKPENKSNNKNNLFKTIELKIDKQSDLKKRLISSIFLFIFMVVYVGLSVLYTQGRFDTGRKGFNIAGYFNFGISVILCMLASYELMKAMKVQKINNGVWLMIGGCILAGVLFLLPWENNHKWAMYEAMDIDSWNKWYVIFVVNIFCIAAFLFIGWWSTKKWSRAFMFVIYMYIVVIGFKGFQTIALTMETEKQMNGHETLSDTWTFGWNTLIWAWGTVILTDTFAYLGGRKFGKTPLAPKVSPKKTWEGSGIGSGVAIVSGILYSVLFFYLSKDNLYSPYMQNMHNLYNNNGHAVPGVVLAFLTIMISLAGQIGDLLFSFYKRVYGIKDFSKLIPGHGGILDRMDSFLFVFFLLYFVCLGSTGGAIA